MKLFVSRVSAPPIPRANQPANRLTGLVALVCALLPAACARHAPAPVEQVHYELGAPYQAAGVWRYPQEHYDLTETGLAVIQTSSPTALTADGEAFDSKALAGAHPTLQLPAIACVTNLENGRQVTIRIDDRGPADPGRMLAVTPHVGSLLEFPASGIARVRVDVLPDESHAAADNLPDAPHFALQAAPRAAVTAIPLSADGAAREVNAMGPVGAAAGGSSVALTGSVTIVPADPGELWIVLSPFHNLRYARMERGRVPDLPGDVEPVDGQDGREYRARLGPFGSVSEADAALAHAIRAGIPDARIVVE